MRIKLQQEDGTYQSAITALSAGVAATNQDSDTPAQHATSGIVQDAYLGTIAHCDQFWITPAQAVAFQAQP